MRTGISLAIIGKARRIVQQAAAGIVVEPMRLAWAKFIVKANP